MIVLSRGESRCCRGDSDVCGTEALNELTVLCDGPDGLRCFESSGHIPSCLLWLAQRPVEARHLFSMINLVNPSGPSLVADDGEDEAT